MLPRCRNSKRTVPVCAHVCVERNICAAQEHAVHASIHITSIKIRKSRKLFRMTMREMGSSYHIVCLNDAPTHAMHSREASPKCHPNYGMQKRLSAKSKNRKGVKDHGHMPFSPVPSQPLVPFIPICLPIPISLTTFELLHLIALLGHFSPFFLKKTHTHTKGQIHSYLIVLQLVLIV